MSFTAKLHGERGNLLWLVNGTYNSLHAWWFVFVKPNKLGSFQKALNNNKILLTEYGEIIESGYGENPSAADLEFVKEKGFKLSEGLIN